MQALDYKTVVTSFIEFHNRILLLRRSNKVGTNRGKWAAISGYLEHNETPLERAKTEIKEEVGLKSDQINLVRRGPYLSAFDEENDTVWRVHPFLFSTNITTVNPDWEHSEYTWINPRELNSYDTVPKLKETFERVRWDLHATPLALSDAFEMIRRLGEDRVNGASSLGRKAVQILVEGVYSSNAETPDDLFRDLLLLAIKMRTVQPNMATLRNLTGKLLNQADLARTDCSVEDFRNIVLSLSQQILNKSHEYFEDTAANLSKVIAPSKRILTHSYSSTIKRALTIVSHAGMKPEVYVTQSHPGKEGEALANDVKTEGLQTKLIHDSTINSIMPVIDVVVVGADSVRANGSVINKIGTRRIAEEAKSKDVPTYVACETDKFSTTSFLGEDSEIAQIFDITPSTLISKLVTEGGFIDPAQVGEKIRDMLRELYT